MRYDVPVAQPGDPDSFHRAELTVARSRFICTIARADSIADAQSFVKQISDMFSDATHNCWAYLVGAPGNTDRIGMSDDGEPHGTAGRPMLTALTHSGIGDICGVVTRYYGGTKLGTGGLVKAYGGAVAQALTNIPVEPKVEFKYLDFVVSYGCVGAIQQLMPKFEIDVLEQSFDEEVRFSVRLPDELETAARAALMDATSGRVTISESVSVRPSTSRSATANNETAGVGTVAGKPKS